MEKRKTKKYIVPIMAVMLVLVTCLTGCGTQKMGDIRTRRLSFYDSSEDDRRGGSTIVVNPTDETEDEEINYQEDTAWNEQEIHLVSDATHYVYYDRHTLTYKVFRIIDRKIYNLTEYIPCSSPDEVEQVYDFYLNVDPNKLHNPTVIEHYIKENYIVIEYKYTAWTGVKASNVDQLYGAYKITEEPQELIDKNEAWLKAKEEAERKEKEEAAARRRGGETSEETEETTGN